MEPYSEGNVSGITAQSIFASAGNDSTIRITDFSKPEVVCVLKGHAGPVHQVTWHPTQYHPLIHSDYSPHIIASGGGDGTIRIWDLRKKEAVKVIVAHLQDVLSIDFNKYENALASGGGDHLVKIWDLKSTKETPLRFFPGHTFPVKKLKFSAFNKNILASGG